MKSLLREPILHFLLGGVILFGLYSIFGEGEEEASNRIVVDEAEVRRLVEGYERIWRRPPSSSELDALVDAFVDEEVLVREALALGLERDDLVIRRRLVQKMEFLLSAPAEEAPVGDAELRAFLERNRERFEEPVRVAFRQVYVDPSRSPQTARARADELRRRLEAERSNGEGEGDRTLLPFTMKSASLRDVKEIFGPGFAEELLSLEGEGWQGPLASGTGLHVVRIDERVARHLPDYESLRSALQRDLEIERREAASRSQLDRLRGEYEIEVELPSSPGREPTPDGGE